MTDGACDEGWLVVAHHHPGRLRVRSRAFEWDETLRDATERWLAVQPGVHTVRCDGPTGSVLVVYDASCTDAGELLTAIAARAHLTIAEPGPRYPAAQRIFDAARALDERVHEFSGGRFGLGLLIPVALGIGSMGSFFSSAHVRVPRWDNLLYWSVQFFHMLNEDQHPRRRRYANDG